MPSCSTDSYFLPFLEEIRKDVVQTVDRASTDNTAGVKFTLKICHDLKHSWVMNHNVVHILKETRLKMS